MDYYYHNQTHQYETDDGTTVKVDACDFHDGLDDSAWEQYYGDYSTFIYQNEAQEIIEAHDPNEVTILFVCWGVCLLGGCLLV